MDWELGRLRRERLPEGATLRDPGPQWALVMTGEARLEADGNTVAMRVGDAVLIDSCTPYRLTATADSELVRANLRQNVSSSPLPSPLVVSGFDRQHPGVAGLVNLCSLGWECRTSLFAMSYAGLLGAAMTASWNAASGGADSDDDADVVDLAAAMRKQPGEPWTLDRMSGHAHLSRSALTSRFRRTFGRSPMEVLREIRMQRARELLGASQPVTRVAFDVGYGSVASFSRAFTAQHGVSPQAWRASASGNADQRPEQGGTRSADGANDQRNAYAEPVEKCPA